MVTPLPVSRSAPLGVAWAIAAALAIPLNVEFAAEFNNGSRDLSPAVVLGFGFESRDDVDGVYADLLAAGYCGQ